MTDLELDVWDAWLRERQEHLEETLSNISPSEEPCRYYLLTRLGFSPVIYRWRNFLL